MCDVTDFYTPLASHRRSPPSDHISYLYFLYKYILNGCREIAINYGRHNTELMQINRRFVSIMILKILQLVRTREMRVSISKVNFVRTSKAITEFEWD